MRSKRFEKGDVVKCKGQSIEMTVVYYDWYFDEYSCMWFDEKKNKRQMRFNSQLLTKV